MRGRQFAEGSVRAFHRAATADGADRSGLTALTYATMMTYAVDAAVAVALANTLFFAAARAESVTNVALYLAITAAPFAVVAPVIGPLLDRVQRGRRAALALTFALRAVLAVVMAFQYHTWLLYPAALGTLVLSKSFVVLKAAVTPSLPAPKLPRPPAPWSQRSPTTSSKPPRRLSGRPCRSNRLVTAPETACWVCCPLPA